MPTFSIVKRIDDRCKDTLSKAHKSLPGFIKDASNLSEIINHHHAT